MFNIPEYNMAVMKFLTKKELRKLSDKELKKLWDKSDRFAWDVNNEYCVREERRIKSEKFTFEKILEKTIVKLFPS